MQVFVGLVTLAALGMVQAPANQSDLGESKARANQPQGPLPPVPQKTLPSTSDALISIATQPTDPLRTPPYPYPSREDLARAGDPKKYDAAVARGRAKADEEIKSDRAKLWEFGLAINIDPIDRETGLYHSGFGCSIDDEIVGRVEGHNARLAEYIRDHGPPKNSFKPWEKELFGLKEYFESRNGAEKPVRLALGGREARSPDGRHVKIERGAYKTWFGVEGEGTYLLMGESETLSQKFPRDLVDAELVWGPKGSWFAVLKHRTERGHSTCYAAYDLREARPIREEYEIDRKPGVTASGQR